MRTLYNKRIDTNFDMLLGHAFIDRFAKDLFFVIIHERDIFIAVFVFVYRLYLLNVTLVKFHPEFT